MIIRLDTDWGGRILLEDGRELVICLRSVEPIIKGFFNLPGDANQP